MNDGNEDFRWNRGAVFTAKGGVEIWAPIDPITHEDVRHMRERVREFQCVGRIRQRPGGVPQCKHCLAAWICSGAVAYDARGSISSAMGRPAAAPTSNAVEGLSAIITASQLPDEVAAPLVEEIQGLGAVHIRELRISDWTGLVSFAPLLEMQKRRILNAIGQ